MPVCTFLHWISLFALHLVGAGLCSARGCRFHRKNGCSAFRRERHEGLKEDLEVIDLFIGVEVAAEPVVIAEAGFDRVHPELGRAVDGRLVEIGFEGFEGLIAQRAGVRQYTFDAVSDLDENFIHIENTQAAVRKVVKAERRVELCLENNRWYDLRRWKDVENTPEMIGDDYGMNSEGTTNETFFKRTVYQTRVWKRCYYWMPVFIDEYEKNPNLVQTPFWLE